MSSSPSFWTRTTAMVRAFFGRALDPAPQPNPELDVERERRRGPGV